MYGSPCVVFLSYKYMYVCTVVRFLLIRLVQLAGEFSELCLIKGDI